MIDLIIGTIPVEKDPPISPGRNKLSRQETCPTQIKALAEVELMRFSSNMCCHVALQQLQKQASGY